MVNLHRLINERNMTPLGENIQKSASLMTLRFAHHEVLAFITGVLRLPFLGAALVIYAHSTLTITNLKADPM